MGERRLTGQVLGGRYRVGDLFGEGGMGEVYEAEHTFIGRRFAVKVLRPEYASNAEAVYRFQREAEAAGGIGHDNICEVIDVGLTLEGAPYLVMPRLAGKTLAGLLTERGPLEVERAIDIARQTLSGLRAAHQAGIVHRDLKPENLFVTRMGDRLDFVKILDFGISKVLDAESLARSRVTDGPRMLGTPSYMAPEQVRGDPDVDHRVDIWAVGVVLYEMLAGRLPFEGSRLDEVLYRIQKGNPKPPSGYRSSLPKELDDVVLKALSLDRDDRYVNAGAFSFQLARVRKHATPRGERPRDRSAEDVPTDVVRRADILARARQREASFAPADAGDADRPAPAAIPAAASSPDPPPPPAVASAVAPVGAAAAAVRVAIRPDGAVFAPPPDAGSRGRRASRSHAQTVVGLPPPVRPSTPPAGPASSAMPSTPPPLPSRPSVPPPAVSMSHVVVLGDGEASRPSWASVPRIASGTVVGIPPVRPVAADPPDSAPVVAGGFGPAMQAAWSSARPVSVPPAPTPEASQDEAERVPAAAGGRFAPLGRPPVLACVVGLSAALVAAFAFLLCGRGSGDEGSGTGKGTAPGIAVAAGSDETTGGDGPVPPDADAARGAAAGGTPDGGGRSVLAEVEEAGSSDGEGEPADAADVPGPDVGAADGVDRADAGGDAAATEAEVLGGGDARDDATGGDGGHAPRDASRDAMPRRRDASTGTHGRPSEAAVQERLAGLRGAVRTCVGGRIVDPVVLSVTIGPDGAVQEAAVTGYVTAAQSACVRRVAERTRFPAFTGPPFVARTRYLSD